MRDAVTQSVEVQTGHVGLNVTDLARSVRFYKGVFGLEVLKESSAEGPLRWRPAGRQTSI